MTREELRNHSAMQACARVYVLRSLGKEVKPCGGDPEAVDIAIDEGFEGNEAEFEEWAREYTASGMGISG